MVGASGAHGELLFGGVAYMCSLMGCISRGGRSFGAAHPQPLTPFPPPEPPSPRLESCLAAAQKAGADAAALKAAWGTIRAGTVAQQVFR
jgi:hypothetical protein